LGIIMEVKEGRLWLGDKVITNEAEASDKVAAVVKERVEKELENTLGMVNVKLPQSSLQKFHNNMDTYDYWVWRRKDSSQDGRHLILISGSKKLTFPGVWSDGAYLQCNEDVGTQFKQIKQAKTDDSLSYDTVCTFHIGETSNEQQKHDSELRTRCLMLHILKNEQKRGSEVDIICSKYAGVCLYKFMSRCPPFASNRLGHLVMLDSEASIDKDLSSIKCEHELNVITQTLKERCTNIVSKDVKSQTLYKIASRAGCDSVSTGLGNDQIPQALHEFITAHYHDKSIERRIFRLRTLLVSFLFVIAVTFILLFRNLK